MLSLFFMITLAVVMISFTLLSLKLDYENIFLYTPIVDLIVSFRAQVDLFPDSYYTHE